MRLILAFLLPLTSTLALAQVSSTSVIPYSGTLFSQGKPVSQSAPVQMAFALYTDTTGLDAGQTDAAPAANRVWSSWGAGDVVLPGSPADNTADGTTSVKVRNGRFLTHLGEALADDPENSQTEIPDSVFDNISLYVVTWVAQELEGGDYSMFRLPPQKLETVPHAVTAKRANGFEVAETLKVDQIEPNSATKVTVNHGLRVDQGGLEVIGNDSSSRGLFFRQGIGGSARSLRSYGSYIALMLDDAYRFVVYDDGRARVYGPLIFPTGLETRGTVTSHYFSSTTTETAIPGSENWLFCALSTVDDDSPSGSCSIRRVNGVWKVRSGGGTGANTCYAHCLH